MLKEKQTIEERLEKVEEFCEKHYYTIIIGICTGIAVRSLKQNKKHNEKCYKAYVGALEESVRILNK